MNKEKIRDWAIHALENLDLNEVEKIGMSEDEYADGAPYLEISIEYKLKGGEQ
ncbi:hypothetical protein WMZ97_13185 [Lentibacillus sp. N15]|uniref:hypothetical protein n=1 Tax=Lentibacillus songyuanensis TaxID=3136161 RepID=UPI0031BB0935